MTEMYFDEVFPHRYLHGDYRPVVQAILQYNNISLPYLMLVDSGADVTVLPKDVITILNIRKEQLHAVSSTGVGGASSAWELEDMRITVGGKEFSCPVRFVEKYSLKFGLLGRSMVFSEIKLACRESVKQIYIGYSR
ncbi:MAG TPA: aspartyl protease family protein [Spirochaetia bacterium]|nr:aspartyl protease family protein [Spirochaetia bacterium]